MSLGTPQSHASWLQGTILNAARSYTAATDTNVAAAGATESGVYFGAATMLPSAPNFPTYNVSADVVTPVLSQHWAPTADDMPPVLMYCAGDPNDPNGAVTGNAVSFGGGYTLANSLMFAPSGYSTPMQIPRASYMTRRGMVTVFVVFNSSTGGHDTIAALTAVVDSSLPDHQPLHNLLLRPSTCCYLGCSRVQCHVH